MEMPQQFYKEVTINNIHGGDLKDLAQSILRLQIPDLSQSLFVQCSQPYSDFPEKKW